MVLLPAVRLFLDRPFASLGRNPQHFSAPGLVRQLEPRFDPDGEQIAMNDSNPYVEARREWNDRYLDLARERRWYPRQSR